MTTNTLHLKYMRSQTYFFSDGERNMKIEVMQDEVFFDDDGNETRLKPTGENESLEVIAYDPVSEEIKLHTNLFPKEIERLLSDCHAGYFHKVPDYQVTPMVDPRLKTKGGDRG